MYVSRQECPLHPFKRLFEGSLERCQPSETKRLCLLPLPEAARCHCYLCACLSCGRRQAGQDAPVEGAFQLFAASTCKRDPAMFILNVHSSFFPIYCYMAICVTKIQ